MREGRLGEGKVGTPQKVGDWRGLEGRERERAEGGGGRARERARESKQERERERESV